MLHKIKVFLELIKFEHSIFALPFAYLGLFLAEGGWPRASVFFWVTVAMVAIRTSAMTLNRLIDEPLDAKNPRTQDRVQSIRFLTRPFLWMMTLTSIAIFLIAAARLNPLCFQLAPIPIFLVWAYPYLKKITWLSHLALGIILGIAPYGGWLASRSEWSWTAGLLTVAVASWVCGFDLFYALQDVGFDRAENLKSFPARFGVEKTLVAAKWLHGLTAVLLAFVGLLVRMGFWYWIGWLVVVGLIAREHRLLARFGLSKVNEAFFHVNAWVSMIIFIATVLELVVR